MVENERKWNNYSEKNRNTLHSGKEVFDPGDSEEKRPSSLKMSQSNDLLVSSPDALRCAQCFLVRVLRDCYLRLVTGYKLKIVGRSDVVMTFNFQ